MRFSEKGFHTVPSEFLLLPVLSLRCASLSGINLLHIALFHQFISQYMMKFRKITENYLVNLIF